MREHKNNKNNKTNNIIRSSFKEKLQDFKGDLDYFLIKLKSTTPQQRMMAAASVAVIAISIGLTGVLIASRIGDDKSQETMAQTKKTDDVETYNNVIMTAESVEKDLNVYFFNDNAEDIQGENFSVKLVNPEDVPAPSESPAPIDQQSLAQYQQQVDALPGETYTDDDADGAIYIDGLKPGTYQVWYVPKGHYFPQESVLTAEVKDTVAYQQIENIEKKVATYDSSKDVKTHVTTTEAEVTDTVNEVPSTTTEHAAEYAQTQAASPVTVQGTAMTVTDNNSVPLCSVTGSNVTIFNQSGIHIANVPVTNIAANVTGISVSSSDSTRATASYSNGQITIMAAGQGAATITVNVTYSGGTATREAITVNVPSTDQQLKDAAGHPLFMDAAGQTPACVKDYNSAASYYYVVKEAYVTYTGWQTIGGETYYYDANGNLVTGQQTIAGVIYNFGTDGKLIKGLGAGIDVSKWQGNINWTKVKNAGINFAVIRCGGRYRDSRSLYEDPKFQANISGATKAGIKVGIYIYSTATTEVEAVEEASLAIKMAGGYNVSLPIFIDMEDSIQSALTTSQRTKIAVAFCETVKGAGYAPGVYANYNWWTTKLNASSLSGYRVWIARYNSYLGYSGKCDIWQYSQSGKVDGISGTVDMNYAYY